MLPIVSVCVQTYNQEPYIKQCLDGILMQQTDFPFEIILGEDESTDGTREICEQYAAQHPNKIKLFLRSRKDVIHINGNPTGRYNFIENLKACTGKYIALCEGDDYWTDPLKLKKQVDFLEMNQDYTICFHKAKILKDGNFEKDEEIDKRYERIHTRPITIVDLIEQGNFIHTPTVVFRNIIEEFPWEFKISPVGDYFLYIMLAHNGLIKRLNYEMAVYRRNVGLYSTLPSFEMKKKILIYHSALLSYLDDPILKEKLLLRQTKLINNLKLKTSINSSKLYTHHHSITWKHLFKIFLKKIQHLYKK